MQKTQHQIQQISIHWWQTQAPNEDSGTLWLCQQFAIENGHRNSEFSHEKWWFSIATLNYQRLNCLSISLGDVSCMCLYLCLLDWQGTKETPPKNNQCGIWQTKSWIMIMASCRGIPHTIHRYFDGCKYTVCGGISKPKLMIILTYSNYQNAHFRFICALSFMLTSGMHPSAAGTAGSVLAKNSPLRWGSVDPRGDRMWIWPVEKMPPDVQKWECHQHTRRSFRTCGNCTARPCVLPGSLQGRSRQISWWWWLKIFNECRSSTGWEN